MKSLKALIAQLANELQNAHEFFSSYVPLRDHQGRSLIDDWSWGPAEDAIKEAKDLLTKHGPFAFDVGDTVTWKTDERHEAEVITVDRRKKTAKVQFERTNCPAWEATASVNEFKLVRRGSFQIQISDYQRERLLHALGRRLSSPFYSTQKGTGEAFDTEREEVQALHDMLVQLPEADKDCEPGTLHGLCL